LTLPAFPPTHHQPLPRESLQATESWFSDRLNESFATHSPRKRTSIIARDMSALCQKRTSATLFDPRRCENLFCLRRGEICEKCFRRVRGRSIAYERRVVARIVLDVRRQRTDQLEALWFEQLDLGDCTESEFIAPAFDDVVHHILASGIARCLGLDLFGYTDSFEQFFQVKSAGRGVVDD
jgi:hypothetical protein